MKAHVEKINDVQNKLKDRKECLENLKTLGDKACSSYDLMMGYNAEYYLKSGLVENQINYYQKELDDLTKNGIQIELF